MVFFFYIKFLRVVFSVICVFGIRRCVCLYDRKFFVIMDIVFFLKRYELVGFMDDFVCVY